MSNFWILDILTSFLECKNGIFYKLMAKLENAWENLFFLAFLFFTHIDTKYIQWPERSDNFLKCWYTLLYIYIYIHAAVYITYWRWEIAIYVVVTHGAWLLSWAISKYLLKSHLFWLNCWTTTFSSWGKPWLASNIKGRVVALVLYK